MERRPLSPSERADHQRDFFSAKQNAIKEKVQKIQDIKNSKLNNTGTISSSANSNSDNKNRRSKASRQSENLNQSKLTAKTNTKGSDKGSSRPIDSNSNSMTANFVDPKYLATPQTPQFEDQDKGYMLGPVNEEDDEYRRSLGEEQKVTGATAEQLI